MGWTKIPAPELGSRLDQNLNKSWPHCYRETSEHLQHTQQYQYHQLIMVSTLWKQRNSNATNSNIAHCVISKHRQSEATRTGTTQSHLPSPCLENYETLLVKFILDVTPVKSQQLQEGLTLATRLHLGLYKTRTRVSAGINQQTPLTSICRLRI